MAEAAKKPVVETMPPLPTSEWEARVRSSVQKADVAMAKGEGTGKPATEVLQELKERHTRRQHG